MSISHRKAFELFHKGMHTRLQFGTGELRADRLQAEALAGLQPDPVSYTHLTLPTILLV